MQQNGGRSLDTYSESEWNGAIASLGRLVDVRNFPDVAADVLMGRAPAFLGRGTRLQTKALNPGIVGALVLWTKGPVDLLIEHAGLREALETYHRNRAVIGLELSVTGLGGTFLEPGIQQPSEVAAGLRKVLDTGLIDPEAIVLRYDPLVKVRALDGRIVRNDTVQAFESVVSLFSALGVKSVETKSLLLSEGEHRKYHHVWERMEQHGIHPLPLDDFPTTFNQLSGVALNLGMNLFSCCIKHFIPGWTSDSGCLSARRLTSVGKGRFGEAWNRISFKPRPSRPGCDCTHYYDLSNVKGHKKCGSQEAACIYCTASCEKFGTAMRNRIRREVEAFCNGEREDFYQHLLTSARQDGYATRLRSC
jgi:hypothetical protein